MSLINHLMLTFLLISLLGCNAQRRKEEKKVREAYEEQVQLDEKILSSYLKTHNITAQRTASGIYYQILEEGTGALAQIDDSVSVDYKGNILYGKQFDSSYLRGKPLDVRIKKNGGLIDGFIEALQVMNQGQRTVFYIPSGLGYGVNGSRQETMINGNRYQVQSIPSNAILVFDIKMLKIIP